MKLTPNENKENEITIRSRTSSNLAKYKIPAPRSVGRSVGPNAGQARRVHFNEHVQVKELIELDSLQSRFFIIFIHFIQSIYYHKFIICTNNNLGQKDSWERLVYKRNKDQDMTDWSEQRPD